MQLCKPRMQLSGRRDLAGVERIDDSGGVDEPAARNVHEHHAGPHQRDGGFVDQVVRTGSQRAVQRQHVRAAEQLLEGNEGRADVPHLLVWKWVIRKHLAAKALQDARHATPDLARSDHADDLAVHVEANLTKQGRSQMWACAQLQSKYWRVNEHDLSWPWWRKTGSRDGQ
eukprot:6187264-Pleurochrysis_carterae.AAC.14